MAKGRRGGTTEQGRAYRQRGHNIALQFAQHLGLDEDYQRDKKAKKDVIDPAGDAHSVKAGIKKWQGALYRRSRFESDIGFQTLNGIGALLIDCIDAFPPTFAEFRQDKQSERAAKELLRIPMIELKDRFQDKILVKGFLMKSIFNGEEVNYLTIHRDNLFHVYWSKEVVDVMAEHFTVGNSTSRHGNPDCQKVIFKFNNNNAIELEMRNESPKHYKEIRLNLIAKKCFELLSTHIQGGQSYIDKPIISYGQAVPNFWKW